MTAKEKTFKVLTLYLARGRSDTRSLSEIVGRLPVTVTLQRGRITRRSARFDLILEGEGEDVRKAVDRIRRSSQPPPRGRRKPRAG